MHRIKQGGSSQEDEHRHGTRKVRLLSLSFPVPDAVSSHARDHSLLDNVRVPSFSEEGNHGFDVFIFDTQLRVLLQQQVASTWHFATKKSSNVLVRGAAWALCVDNLSFLCLLVCLCNRVANHLPKLPAFHANDQLNCNNVVGLVDGQLVVDGVSEKIQIVAEHFDNFKLLVASNVGKTQCHSAASSARSVGFNPIGLQNRKSNRAHICQLAVETLWLAMSCHRECHMHIVWLEFSLVFSNLFCAVMDVDNAWAMANVDNLMPHCVPCVWHVCQWLFLSNACTIPN